MKYEHVLMQKFFLEAYFTKFNENKFIFIHWNVLNYLNFLRAKSKDPRLVFIHHNHHIWRLNLLFVVFWIVSCKIVVKLSDAASTEGG